LRVRVLPVAPKMGVYGKLRLWREEQEVQFLLTSTISTSAEIPTFDEI